MSKIVELNNVSKTYGGASHPSLHSVRLFMLEGEFTVIIGPAGSGKTTLLQVIAGLEDPSAGEVIGPERVGMVFHDAALLPWLTATQNVELVLRAQGMSAAKVRRRARLGVERVGLHKLADAYPRDLSAGQRYRVSLARALVVEAGLLLLDDPFTALDLKTGAKLHDDLLRIWGETGQTIIMASDSVEEAVTLADQIILMNAGRVVRTYQLADMERPRRAQAEAFIHQVQAIRRDFLALGE